MQNDRILPFRSGFRRQRVVRKTRPSSVSLFLVPFADSQTHRPRTIDLDSHTALLGLTNYISSNNLQQPAILFMQPTSVDDSFSFAGLHDSLLRQGRVRHPPPRRRRAFVDLSTLRRLAWRCCPISMHWIGFIWFL